MHSAFRCDLIHQLVEVIDALLQGVGIIFCRGLVREPTADVVGHDAAVVTAQGTNHVTVVVTPGGITVDHQHHVALALIHVVEG